MKDWKAEHDKIKGQLKATEDELARLQRREDERAFKHEDWVNRFRQLVLDALERP